MAEGLLTDPGRSDRPARVSADATVNCQRRSAAFDRAGHAMAVAQAPSGRITEVNHAWTAMAGIAADQAHGRTSLELGLWGTEADYAACLAEVQSCGRLAARAVSLRLPAGLAVVAVSAEAFAVGDEPCVLWEFGDQAAITRARGDLDSAHDTELAHHAVRLAIARMTVPEDLSEVVAECARQMQRLHCSPFDNLGLQILNDERTDFEILSVRGGDRPASPLWREGTHWAGILGRAALHPWVVEAVTNGRPHYQPNTPVGGPLSPGCSVLDVPFSHGTLAINRQAPEAFSLRDVLLLAGLAEVVGEGFQRFQDLVRHRQAQRQADIGAAVQRIRNRVLQMQHEDDWPPVVRALTDELAVFVTFDHYCVFLMDETPGPRDTLVVDRVAVGRASISWRERPALVEALETGRPVYRRSRRDPLFSPQIESRVNSVVDIPFVRGTLAVNSDHEDAFDAVDLAVLEQFAHVLGEAHRRVRDLQALDEQRLQAERQLKLDLALQRLRNRVLEMTAPDDWRGLAVSLRHELAATMPLLWCGINFVDPLQRGFRAVYIAPDGTMQETSYNNTPTSLRQAMGEGVPVYRRNRAEMAALNENLANGIHSVLDVPFVGGTLAVNAACEDAFSAPDIEALARFAQVLTEAFRRLDDLRQIEAHRQQRERQLNLDLALQRARVQVLQMNSREDWQRVFAVLDEEVRRLTPAAGCCVARVDLDAGLATFRHVSSEIEGDNGPRPWKPLKAALREAVETGRTVYRRNRVEMAHYGDSVPDRLVRCIVDVPFGAGTLSINSHTEQAFADADLVVLERLAQVLAEAERRQRDIDERARLQQEVEAQQLRAAQADRLQALGEMATGVAHELNQPLNGIRTFAEGALLAPDLGWTPSSEETTQTFRDIVVQVDRISAIIDHMRVFARDDADQPAVAFAAAEPIEGALKLLGAQLRLRGIELQLEAGRDLPPCIGWPNAVEQVLLNLLSNSRDAIEERQVQVGPDWHPRIGIAATATPDGQWVTLVVDDNAGGVPEAILGRIFDPYFTTKPVGKGTGIGLAIARGIVVRHGGTIEVHNRPGEGVAFTIALPTLTSQQASLPPG